MSEENAARFCSCSQRGMSSHSCGNPSSARSPSCQHGSAGGVVSRVVSQWLVGVSCRLPGVHGPMFFREAAPTFFLAPGLADALRNPIRIETSEYADACRLLHLLVNAFVTFCDRSPAVRGT